VSEFKGKIAVIDDDEQMRLLLKDFLTREKYDVICFAGGEEAYTTLSQSEDEVNLIITDLKMAHMDGMQFLKKIKITKPEIPVVLITAFGSIDTAIEAMRNGAFHYLVKPFKLVEIIAVVELALKQNNLTKENTVLRNEVKKSYGLKGMIGKSKAIKSVFDLIKRVSQSTANVLITGESGTGKEVVARAIHQLGDRANFPFVAINCTAIPENLLESELFGHAKGSFTGAVSQKSGLIKEANGGTLFLDEIGDMSPALQAKLLRVLQERKIRPVGDNTTYDVDIRVIAATHQDLKKSIKEGTFREDLYYRLSVIPISLPALRERSEDIPLLAEHFLKKFKATTGHSTITGFSKSAMNKLMSLRWSGNVRELENVIERAVVLCQASQIEEEDIPTPDVSNPTVAINEMTQDFPTLEELEKRYMQVILQKTMGRKDKAAEMLGINRRTLYRKEREYGWSHDELSLH